MPLTREELIRLSETYFEGCNDHDHDRCMNTFANDCLMWFPAAEFRYPNKDVLGIHFRDFFKTFKTILFRDYTHIVDVESQSITTYFDVKLIPYDGDEVNMKNCNIFHLNDQGLFREIIIYNSGALSAGFHEGNE